MSIKQITVLNDDGTTEVFALQVAAPEIQTITVPLGVPVQIVAAPSAQ